MKAIRIQPRFQPRRKRKKGCLSQVVITMQGRVKTYGYFGGPQGVYDNLESTIREDLSSNEQHSASVEGFLDSTFPLSQYDLGCKGHVMENLSTEIVDSVEW